MLFAHRLPVAGQLSERLAALDVQFDGIADRLEPGPAVFRTVGGEDCSVAGAADFEIAAEHFEGFALFEREDAAAVEAVFGEKVVLVFEHSAVDEQVGHEDAVLFGGASVGFELSQNTFFEDLSGRFDDPQRFVRK